MTNAIDRAGRTAAAAGLLGAVILCPIAVAASGLVSPAPTRFAQAAVPPPAATAPLPTPPAAPGAIPPGTAAAPQQARDPQVERRVTELHRRLRVTPAQ